MALNERYFKSLTHANRTINSMNNFINSGVQVSIKIF